MTEHSIRRILLLEHDVTLLELMGMALELEGFVVHRVTDGEAAKTAMLEQMPDIVLSCMMMPAGHAFELLHWLRQEQANDIPVVILTRRRVSDLEERLKAAGATKVLFKPVKIPDLVLCLKQL